MIVHVSTEVPTDIYGIEEFASIKNLPQKREWEFELGLEYGNEEPICVMVGFLWIDRLNNQELILIACIDLHILLLKLSLDW